MNGAGVLTRFDAERVHQHAASAIATARRTTRRAQVLVEEAQRLRRRGTVRFFVVRGEIEERPARAIWSQDRLIATRALLERAELLVQLGDRFETTAGSSLEADLGQPLPALLTLIRACDRAQEISFGPVATPRARRRPNGMVPK